MSAPRVAVLGPRASRYCLCIPVINEGERLHAQLYRMRDIAGSVDVVIADGGSTDGSVALPALREFGVRAVIPKSEPGALSTQLRLAFAYALEAGYDGVATMDGNNKDDPASIPLVLRALDLGYDHVQGSRFVPGGRAVATPWTRLVAIRLLHAPVISLAAGVRYTDTTNGFRGYSRRFLLDPRVAPLRPVFRGYELPYYLAAQAGRLGYRVIEVPVTRRYPPGRVPTKIRPLVGHLEILSALWAVWRGRYAPPISPDERETRWPSA
ncbi:MAG TPA: glycosyltransferase family 2 protein [Nitrospiria bacterium]|nr:glycosyltransferase family 2 protein [Nitrospiria bacterium]